MVRIMDRIGVGKILLSSLAGLHSDFAWGNDDVHKAAKQFPDRIFGYIFVNPNYSHGVADEIERSRKLGGFKGICTFGYGFYSYKGKKYVPCWELSAKYDLPILADSWGDNAVNDLGEIAKQHPNAKIILAHSGPEDFYKNIEVAKNNDNVFIEISVSKDGFSVVELFVKHLGAEKVLFGSDFSFLALSHQLGKVLYAKISDSDKEKILSGNAKRLFKF